jgi:hypothetical protein
MNGLVQSGFKKKNRKLSTIYVDRNLYGNIFCSWTLLTCR